MSNPIKNIPPEPSDKASSKELSDYYETSLDQLEGVDLTKEEIKNQQKLIQKATKNYSKQRSQLNLTMPDDKLTEFKKLAKKKGAPVSTLARMWLIERLNTELNQT